MSEYLLCSDCFTDTGLKLDAEKNGISNELICNNCKSSSGKKLNFETLNDLAHIYFVQGSAFKADYGAAPAIQFNEYHFGKDTINAMPWLKNDIALISSHLHVGFFHYGPRMWTLGNITPLINLQNKKTRNTIINRILREFPKIEMSKDTVFYRVRKNPANPSDYKEFDTPPIEFIGNGRLDSKTAPILYASQDIEACIHECRVTIEDEIYVATLALKQNFIFLDLTAWIEEHGTEFESLNLALHFLFRAPERSYEVLRAIAEESKKAGFAGIIYPSYYTQVHRSNENDTIKNVAMFGWPISEGHVRVDCINRIILNKVLYDLSYGPVGF